MSPPNMRVLQLGAEFAPLVEGGKGVVPVADYRLATEVPHPVPAGPDLQVSCCSCVAAVLQLCCSCDAAVSRHCLAASRM